MLVLLYYFDPPPLFAQYDQVSADIDSEENITIGNDNHSHRDYQESENSFQNEINNSEQEVNDCDNEEVNSNIISTGNSYTNNISGNGQATFSQVYPLVSNFLIAIFLNFFVILSVFPGVTSSVYSINNESSRPSILKELFTPLHFLIYNLFDFLGKSLPIFMGKTFECSSRILLMASIARLLFIPAFLACNVKFYSNQVLIPRPQFIPLIFSDLGFFTLIALLGLSSGVINSLGFIGGAKSLGVVGEVGGAYILVGDLMGIGLGTGLAAGSLFAFALRYIMCGCNPFVS